MDEKISAFFDGELSKKEIGQTLRRLREEPGLLEEMEICLMMQEAMNQERVSLCAGRAERIMAAVRRQSAASSPKEEWRWGWWAGGGALAAGLAAFLFFAGRAPDSMSASLGEKKPTAQHLAQNALSIDDTPSLLPPSPSLNQKQPLGASLPSNRALPPFSPNRTLSLMAPADVFVRAEYPFTQNDAGISLSEGNEKILWPKALIPRQTSFFASGQDPYALASQPTLEQMTVK